MVLTNPSREKVSNFRFPSAVDAPTEIFVATIPPDHLEYDEAIAGEPGQTSSFLIPV
jgi:hypothetical protein